MRLESTSAVGAGTIVVDESRSPLLLVTIVGLPSDERFAQYLDELSRFAGRGRRYGAIIDLSRGDRASPWQREAMARWNRTHHATLEQHCAGVALVITSAWVRGALTAMTWLHRPPQPIEVFATFAEADAWVKARLDVPPA